MTKPLVSILVPAFNSGLTIQRALSSLVAQTVEDWEAVFVDDGSTDDTWSRSLSVEDRRIHRFRRRENLGRGAVRQFALRQSSGSFICMLDADDWYYPWKLEVQLEALDDCPDAVLVSSAMASVEDDGGLAGIWRGRRDDHDGDLAPQLKSLFDMRFPHAPSMIRSAPARACRYRSELLRAEEYHYLARVLRGKRYMLSSRVLYSYSDAGSFLREGPVPRYLWSALASLKLIREFPASAPPIAARKAFQAMFALLSGGRRLGTRMRPSPATGEEVSDYERARSQVDEAVAWVGRASEQKS